MSGSILRPLFGVLRLGASQYTHKVVSPLVCGCQTTRNYAQQTQQVEAPMSDHERRLKDFFRCYDLNGDGEITREELFKAMKRAVGYNDVGTNQIVDAIYADCEKEKNDIITFEDFKKGIRIVSFKK